MSCHMYRPYSEHHLDLKSTGKKSQLGSCTWSEIQNVMVLEPAVPEIDKEPLFGQVEEMLVVDSIQVYLYVDVFDTPEYNISAHTLLNPPPIRKCTT